jgi:plastocyanin
MRRLLLTCGASVALLAAGCGGGGGSGGSNTGANFANTGTPTSGPVTKVSMKNIQFDPKTITVKQGTVVQWTNDDSVSHDVTKDAGPGPQFSSGSGNLQSGDTYRVKFDAAGTVKYECTVHPGMTGTIVVK